MGKWDSAINLLEEKYGWLHSDPVRFYMLHYLFSLSFCIHSMY
jgi:hypothetical protein